MSRWNHTVCRSCYADLYPDREPTMVVFQEPATCCRCAGDADQPVNVRVDPATLSCGGKHGDDAA
jgi:hypothetical protein